MTTVIRIPKAITDQMVAHCFRGRPNEACGILATKNGKVVDVFCMSNAAASPLRYSLDAREQFDVYRSIEEGGYDLGGVFHSHTHSPAYPSQTDIRLATEDIPYLIVSLASERPVLRAFRIFKHEWTDPEGTVTELNVSILG